MTPEVMAKVNMWRTRAAEGSLTPDEMKGAIDLLREGRQQAAKSSAAAVRTKAKAAIPSADDLLRELGIE